MPRSLPEGDKTYVQLATSEDSDSKAKPKVGTFYVVVKSLEKAAAKQGTPLTLTSYGKVEAKGTAGKHGFGFEFPDNHPKHTAQDYVLSTAKAGAKTTNSGNFFATLALRDGWAGACTPMWRLAHDPVRSAMHARKPMVISKDNITLKKGVPMKVLWIKRGEGQASKPSGSPNPGTETAQAGTVVQTGGSSASSATGRS